MIGAVCVGFDIDGPSEAGFGFIEAVACAKASGKRGEFGDEAGITRAKVLLEDRERAAMNGLGLAEAAH